MALNPMQKKARTSFLLGMFLMLIITGIIIGLLIYQISNMKKAQDAIIYKEVYVLSSDITSGGEVIGKSKIQKVVAENAPANSITSRNIKELITEKTKAKIDLKKGTVLTENMIYQDEKEISSDMRLQEYNMIVLPSQLEDGEFIDVRLRLPSGEDYIVLSRKEVMQADGETVWLNVAEEEILTMSNAVVEAYIMKGSLLYATTYKDAGMQNAAIPTYIVTGQVLNLIRVDPNITTVAFNELATRYNGNASSQRPVINQAVSGYNENALQNIETNTANEIEKQKAARQQYVDELNKLTQ